MFATVASHESRPLADVLTEALSEQAARWTRTRHTLLIDPRDQALLDDYLDALEADTTRLERMEEEANYRRATTPMMEAAARASDERERSYHTDTDDAADFWQRVSGHEDITVQVAIAD